MPRLKITERVALVTGSSGEIGSAIVKRLVRDGFRVAIHYKKSRKRALTLANSLKNHSQDIFLVDADISKEREVRAMIGKIIKKFGRLDVVVNNAGINIAQPSPEYLKISDIDKILDVNLRGSILVTKYAIPFLQKTDVPRIVFISSIVACSGSATRVAYSASKSAIVGLMRSLSVGLAPQILVNAVVPGYIDTKMIRRSKTEPLSKRIRRIPLKRLGTTAEVAAAVNFLCSEDASYITGQCIHVNGGAFLS